MPADRQMSENRRPPGTVTPEVPPPVAITIDLSKYARTRGTETSDSGSWLSLPAAVSRVTLKCPIGWEAGPYRIRVHDSQGLNRADIQAEGLSALGRTVISFDIDLRGLQAGAATLRVRPPGLSWRSFRVLVHHLSTYRDFSRSFWLSPSPSDLSRLSSVRASTTSCSVPVGTL